MRRSNRWKWFDRGSVDNRQCRGNVQERQMASSRAKFLDVEWKGDTEEEEERNRIGGEHTTLTKNKEDGEGNEFERTRREQECGRKERGVKDKSRGSTVEIKREVRRISRTCPSREQ